ncbi:hypothetical protein BO85DRAFT_146764 [Aspergillus piperis CBS 112811]|uniref:Transmembrane protein n=1 Tax=Aspergillus piperis CBS 112811 TaxID=1448313 RepID=A0A8G1QZ20_9EURO|nr:hypothetical protein BO85DRAFT_146764 [Aspergillus piperis CBS 112811]RAH53920.1 hypothetical protein BO85DRAFT_146764 [Aspergillus piperis CBS 112811]
MNYGSGQAIRHVSVCHTKRLTVLLTFLLRSREVCPFGHSLHAVLVLLFFSVLRISFFCFSFSFSFSLWFCAGISACVDVSTKRVSGLIVGFIPFGGDEPKPDPRATGKATKERGKFWCRV